MAALTAVAAVLLKRYWLSRILSFLSQTAVGMTRVLRPVGVSSSAKAGMSLPRLAVMRPMLRESMSEGKSTVSVRVPLM